MIKNRLYSTLSKRSDENAMSEKVRVCSPPPIRIEGLGLPCPVPEESSGGWTPTVGSSLGLTPISLGITPSMKASLGMISPMASPFGMVSPFGKAQPMISPWGEFARSVFASPGQAKTSPPSLSENRAELVNLIVHH
jgi:hypothetical protein